MFVLLEDDVRHVKDTDLIRDFELIVDLHYDTILQLILKMMIRNLLYKAKESIYNKRSNSFDNLHEDRLTFG